MNRTEMERLANAVTALRPDWPTSSVRSFLAKNLADRAYRDVAVALVWCATDPDTLTPARVLGAGPWWLVGGTSAPTKVPPRFVNESIPAATTEQYRGFAAAARAALTHHTPQEGAA